MPAITTTDGVEIFYKDWGKGPPIVFSHGYTEIIGLHGLTEFGEREFFNRPAHRESRHCSPGHQSARRQKGLPQSLWQLRRHCPHP